MNRINQGGFLGQVYDAALDEALWPNVLEGLADRMGGTAAALIWQDQADRGGTALAARCDPVILELYFAHFAKRHGQLDRDRPRDRVRRFVPHIVADDSQRSKAQLIKTDFYNDFMRPFDMHSIVRIGLAAEGLTTASLVIARSERRGRFSPTDLATAASLHPHLMRAFQIGQAVGALRNRSEEITEALERSPRGVILLDRQGGVRYANLAAETIISRDQALIVRAGRLAGLSAEETRQLRRLVDMAASREQDLPTGGSMSLTHPDRRLPLLVTVAPLRSIRLPDFKVASVIVCVTDPQVDLSLPEARLHQLFGLSRMETQVALALYEDQNPRQAAAALGLSVHTVRVHLGHVFEKTHTHSQAQLARLLARAASIGVD